MAAQPRWPRVASRAVTRLLAPYVHFPTDATCCCAGLLLRT